MFQDYLKTLTVPVPMWYTDAPIVPVYILGYGNLKTSSRNTDISPRGRILCYTRGSERNTDGTQGNLVTATTCDTHTQTQVQTQGHRLAALGHRTGL